MRKLAFFDFCGTLVSFQTADAFVDFVRKHEGSLYMRMLDSVLNFMKYSRAIAFLNIFFPNAGVEKRMKLMQLKGISYERLNQYAANFYEELIKPDLLAPVVNELNKLREKGYEICIVSAGYSLYLKYFAIEYPVEKVIATEIVFSGVNKRCKGKILGRDCIKEEKVKRIAEQFKEKSIDYSASIAFSDSISDLPLLLTTGEGVVISKGRSQGWNLQHNLKEIIWD